jgi:hypothetical protein
MSTATNATAATHANRKAAAPKTPKTAPRKAANPKPAAPKAANAKAAAPAAPRAGSVVWAVGSVCKHGHELTTETLYLMPSGRSQCRTCRRGYVSNQPKAKAPEQAAA